MSVSLDGLIQQRTGGAVNVRGIRFQILYTLRRALDAHASGHLWTVTPEGLEDVDVQVGRITEHVQVKTSKNEWTPHRLKAALTSIVDAARACDSAHSFTVLLAGDANDDVRALVGRHHQSARAPLDAALATLLRKAGAEAPLADALAGSLSIRLSSENALDHELPLAAVRAFGAHPASAPLLVQSLAAFVLDHARLRQSFGPVELNRAYAAIADGQATAAAFEARGRALVHPVDWTADGGLDDFADGRGTRPAHIAAGLDVERPRWTSRIADVLEVSRLCVVRAPSGQGKSALAFRFARDRWDPEATLVLSACETAQDAAQAADYLRARATLGIPTALLVDGADWRLQHWPTVAAAARDRGIPVLATVRVEDWRRFAAGSAVDLAGAAGAPTDEATVRPLADAAVVEPYLDLTEARALFRSLGDRAHASVRSADQAFEQVGTPALLMEYLYLVTHGELLRHRLQGQISALQRQHDDGHLSVLRLATFAHACGVPLPTQALFDGRPEDPQRVLSQVDGEYVRLLGRDLAELHRVRSEHLAALLHAGGVAPVETARRVLPLLPTERLGPFVAGALRYPGLDRDAFYPALADHASAQGPAAAAALADGLFESGERDFLAAMEPVYAEAETLMGSSGPFLLSILFAPNPLLDVYDNMTRVADSTPNGAGDRFRTVRRLAEKAPRSDRGGTLVRPLLAHVLPLFSAADLLAAPGPAGRLLQEAARLGLDAPTAEDALAGLSPSAPDGLPDLSSLLLGVHAHAPAATERWVRRHAQALGQSTAEHLGLVSPPAISHGPDGPAVDVVFYPSDADGARSVNDQAVSHLRLVRELYPFAVHFRSRAHWLLPGELVPTLDESVKDMAPGVLRSRLERDRQGLWKVIGDERSASPTLWAYQESWSVLRMLAVDVAEALEQAVRAKVEGRTFDLARALARDGLGARLDRALLSTPQPPSHASRDLVRALGEAAQWESVLRNVIHQTVQYADASDPNTGRLLSANAYGVAERLDGLHGAFDALFAVSPDSFNLRALRDRERQAYAALAGAVEFWTSPPLPIPVQSLRKALRDVHRRRDDALGSRVAETLEREGIALSLEPTVYRSFAQQTVVLALPISHPCLPESSRLEEALSALGRLGDATPTSGRPGTLWVALTVDGARFDDTAYRFFSHQLHRAAEDGELNWEAYAPLVPPAEVTRALSAIPIHVPHVYRAWKAACSTLMLCLHVEAYVAADPAQHPQAVQHLPDLRERVRVVVLETADALRTDMGSAPVALSAADRLDEAAHAFGSGGIPTAAVQALVNDLAHTRAADA